MNIIYFTNNEIKDSEVIPGFLAAYGDKVYTHTDRIDMEVVTKYKADFIVSDRARFLIRLPVLKFLENRVVNMHPSFLPYNRGYHPQFWSVAEGTPSGVTVHYIDEGIDTGDIIAQRRVLLNDRDTLRTSYDKHREAMVALFKETWPLIRERKNRRTVQSKQGTLHYNRDFYGIFDRLSKGWDTSIIEIKHQFLREGAL